jgi:hypothetical protein
VDQRSSVESGPPDAWNKIPLLNTMKDTIEPVCKKWNR